MLEHSMKGQLLNNEVSNVMGQPRHPYLAKHSNTFQDNFLKWDPPHSTSKQRFLPGVGVEKRTAERP